MGHNQKVGRWGENMAVRHLSELGYEIIGVNIRTPFGELDAVTRKEGMLVIVEVKTRTSDTCGNPEGAVTKRKLEHIINSALYYLADRGWENEDWRVDVVAISGRSNDPMNVEIMVFENAVSS